MRSAEMAVFVAAALAVRPIVANKGYGPQILVLGLITKANPIRILSQDIRAIFGEVVVLHKDRSRPVPTKA